MPSEPGRVISTALPAGETFYDALATAVLERCADQAASGDLSHIVVLVPALPIAAELRNALHRAAGRPLLLPRFDTLAQWVENSGVNYVDEIGDPLPESQRLVLLHEALRERGWFDESALWGIAGEMAVFFDELTTASICLPGTLEAFVDELQRAYSLRSSMPLAFEARVIHELWRALALAGRPDAVSAYHLRLATLAHHAELEPEGFPELVVLLDAAPEEALDPAESAFLERYAARRPITAFHPAPRRLETSPMMAVLAMAWPEEPAGPLVERANDVARRYPASPLLAGEQDRLRLVATNGREHEARAAVAQIGEWLAAGLRRIALIAQDRLTARRVRALLEREGVLVSDETGWKLSTSRAAATIDALLETAAGNAYYRDLLDLCKSPFVFADSDERGRKASISFLESAVRSASARAGLSLARRALLEAPDDEAKPFSLAALDRVEAAMALLRAKPAPLARWIGRLFKALEVLGALDALRQDAAGNALIELLEMRREELAESGGALSFAVWRDWLNRECEAANFRDSRIVSPIVITPLNAVCLRRFEAAILLGGDARQLTPANGGEFFNQSVRRDLGLRTRQDGERELRRDLELLLATVPRVVVSWQAEQDGEANLLAPEFALLSTLHQVAWGDDLQRMPLPVREEPRPDVATLPEPLVVASPVVPRTLLPRRVSVSAYATLVGCPYRFFARYVLGLGEMDEVSEEMAKSDYGALVHRTLELFHEHHPLVSVLGDDEALAALRSCVEEVFAPAVEDNFLAVGWRLRWEKHLPAYVAWQREQEAAGWRWSRAEVKAKRDLLLADGDTVEFYGRIDRVDEHANGGTALYDYKTQRASTIRERLKDDVQLPAYALLHGDAEHAAYVALDDEKIVMVAAADEDHENADGLRLAAEAQGERLKSIFDALRAGARLPAQGTASICRHCEMYGLCRKVYR